MISIGFLASQLGVTTSTIRKWETRYGYPKPLRSEKGTRFYNEDDLAILLKAKKLIDSGIRPSKIFSENSDLVNDFAKSSKTDQAKNDELLPIIEEVLSAVKTHDYVACQKKLEAQLAEIGIERFVSEIATPLMIEVGKVWASDQLDIFEEHAIAQVMRSILDNFSRHVSINDKSNTIVLAVPPGELHSLSLSMVCASLSSAEINCVNLGGSMPIDSLVKAANSFKADIVGLSISPVSASKSTLEYIQRLRNTLPARVKIWIGGSGASSLKHLPENVDYFRTVEDALVYLKQNKINCKSSKKSVA